ncbi:MAG: hypothetical protein Q8S92_15420 [Hydrogenophaga sp.]|jgi:hypothetical protein|uniref:hypothetical protein n=1 Tax=Hydrogenophaga sp. TaxID=1904254 RepID=UPI0027355780|nr:hypothetical protein [Hydrogenophaga sp.]MDP3350379.1 hypothetical protein [Hydrogenophaga sp.]
MRKTVDLWIFLAVVFAMASSFSALKNALPYALDFVQSSALTALGICALVTGMWAVHRHGRWRAYLRDLLQSLGWLLVVWAAIGWWSIAVDAGALGASLYCFPVMILAAVLIAYGRAPAAESQ